MRAIFINVFALVIGLFTGLMLQAQPGVLDPTFGDGGTLSVDFDSLNDEAKGIIVQPDGKILVAGSASIDYVNKFAIARLNPDGTFDTTFGTDGKVETQMGNSNITFGECIALQPDGKIIVAGSVFIGTTYYMAVARYNSDGQLDESFSGDGMMTYSPGGSVFIKAIAIQDDGAILLAGSSGLLGAATHISVLKLNSDGTIDESFGDGTGQLVTEVGESSGALGLAIQSNGNIIVAGYTNDGAYNDVVVVRYSENGVLDTTFDGDGIRTLILAEYDDFATQILQVAGGKIMISGVSNTEFALVRFNTNGTLDTSFGGDGIVVTDMDDTFDEFHDFAIDADGLIVAIGHSGYPLNSISACRYNFNGTLDDLFSMDGKTTIDMSDTYEYAYGIAIQADGKILIAGSTDSGGQNDFAIIRLQGVCPLISHTQDLEICSGESVTVGSSTYNSAGSYEDIITLPTGCDSLVTSNLNILPNSASTQNVTIGAGESYTIGNSTYTQSGTYQDVLIAANGCDSVVTTNLTITTGIGIIAGESPLKIWPVPFEDIINIDGCELNDVVSITDLQGRIIRTVLINRLPYAIDLSNLTTGSYLLVHENDEGITTRRVFKIN